MPLLPIIDNMINPYLVQIKLAIIALSIAAIIGGYLYVRGIFRERDALMKVSAQTAAELTTERQRTKVLQEQIIIWQDTSRRMNEALKNIKIQSDVYIQGVENEKEPSFNGNDTIPFIVPQMPTVSDRTNKNDTSGTTGSATP